MFNSEKRAREKAETAEASIRLMFARDMERTSAKHGTQVKAVADWLTDCYGRGEINVPDMERGLRRVARVSVGTADAGELAWFNGILEAIQPVDHDAQRCAVREAFGDRSVGTPEPPSRWQRLLRFLGLR